jgi:hypothetical protein
VPEAAIYKHDDVLLQKDKIRFTWQRLVPPPAYDSVRTKNGCQFQFGIFVAFRPNGSHNL